MHRRASHWLLLAFALAGAARADGPAGKTDKSEASPPAPGYTIVLPGCDGKNFLNRQIVRGLEEAGHPSTVELVDWTTGVAPMLPLHLVRHDRNRARAGQIAAMIMNYRLAHPERPIYLVGHSCGGAMVVFVLEALPERHKVTSAVLLAPTLAPDYDLSKALAHCDHGLWNIYSKKDFFFSGLGTLTLGTLDRKHRVAAGAVGFQTPFRLSEVDRNLYRHHLFQLSHGMEMRKAGHSGLHYGCRSREFVSSNVAPLLR